MNLLFVYHLKIFISSTLTVSLFLKSAMIIARPTAASAAATAITKNTNSCPIELPRYDENVTKVKFAELSINSMHIKTIMAFRLIKTPATPIVKSAALKTR